MTEYCTDSYADHTIIVSEKTTTTIKNWRNILTYFDTKMFLYVIASTGASNFLKKEQL